MSALAVIAAAAALHTVDVPQTVGESRIDDQKDRTGLAVLLPQTLRTDYDGKVYANSLPAGDDRYGLVLGASRFCNGASACAIAGFSAVEGAKPSGGRKVKLAKGRRGRFYKSRCGATCSFPAMEWRERGALYRIDYKEGAGVKSLERLANSTIRNGPR